MGKLDLRKPVPYNDAPAEDTIAADPEVGAQVSNKTKIIKLKERNLIMLKNDLILRNPLRLMGRETDAILPQGGFGVVMARAGVGKTALLVQLALNSLLREINVLHISLDDPVQKVNLWYKEMFRHLSASGETALVKEVWESLLPHRFIMTFKVEGFSVPKLEERLTDLTAQDIFQPSMILIDEMPFDASIRQPLSEMKELAKKFGVHVWFAVTTHRHETPAPDGMPTQLTDVADLFEVAIQLQPDGKEIHVKALKGLEDSEQTKSQVLDPTTMLLVEDK